MSNIAGPLINSTRLFTTLSGMVLGNYLFNKKYNNNDHPTINIIMKDQRHVDSLTLVLTYGFLLGGVSGYIGGTLLRRHIMYKLR